MTSAVGTDGLAFAALAMAAATAYLVRYAVDAARRLRFWVAVFLLAMMGEMWGAAIVYLLTPTVHGLVAGLAVSGSLMVVTAVPLLFALLRPAPAERPGAASSDLATPLRSGHAGVLAAVVLANEFLMGWGLCLASGTALAAVSSGTAASLAVAVVNSPWFLFTMAAEMLLTALLLYDRLPRSVSAILLAQAAIMAFSPPALGGAVWPGLAIYVSSAVMIGLFVFVFEDLYRHRVTTAAFATYLLELLGVYALMMLGLFVWIYFASGGLFALSIVAEMAVVYFALARPRAFSGPAERRWLDRPHWTFALLSFVFVAEVAMGAVLSVQLDPSDYVGGFPFLALAGSPATIALNTMSNGFWFVATAVASTWFLIMMGLEMGSLVVFKLRETRDLENRIRLVLMMGCYAAFATFYPSIYFGMLAPNQPPPTSVPVLGWSMGIGSAPLAVGVFGTLLLTYVITGALVVLFGRRVVCSVFCTAPLMYQGTTIDAMKSFNRSEPIGRKYLSSRLSGVYLATTGVVMTALVGTSVLSYLDTVGVTSVYIQGTDPSVFLFIASFSILWYALLVGIPYVGNYNCVTMGWCYTGTIAQAFQKIGFFKLKVRDRQVCKDCTTLDCAKGCPVGLTDMPGHFRQKGEFRSTKCCGVGDCVEACPYDNLYVSDVRHWVRRRLGLPETRARRTGTPMPGGSRAFGRASAAGRVGTVPLASEAIRLPMAGDARSPRSA